MNIGIIIHSQTGHTYSVAERIKEKLAAAGHGVNIERVTPVGEAHPGIKNLQLETKPPTEPYDALIFAAPVWAFTLSPVLAAYLAQLPSLQGKKTACFVTMGFPFSWMGGNRAVTRIQEICAAKGATVCGAAVLHWMGRDREPEITVAVERLSGLF